MGQLILPYYCLFISPSGDQYIGSWRDAHRHGKGVLRLACGDRYEGQFYHGFFFGTGKFTWSDGGYYEVSGVYIYVCVYLYLCDGGWG